MRKTFLLLSSTLMGLFVFSQSPSLNYDLNGNHKRNHIQSQAYIPSQNKDAGYDWHAAGPYGGDVFDIVFAPGNPNKTLVAAGSPYYRMNASDEWHIIDNLLNLSPGGIHTLEASANGSIYAAGDYNFYKIFKSDDDGESWSNVNVPISGSCLDITVDPADPNTIYIASSSNLSGTQNNVIARSTDGGLNWTAFNMISILPIGWACVNIEVDPDNSQNIYAIGNESFSNAAAIASFDGGTTWSNITGNLPSGKPYNSLTIKDGVIYICGGQLFGGNVMGVYKSEDNGSTWQSISASFPNKVVSTLLINPDNALKMYAATEGDGVYYTVNGGITWNYDTNGDGDKGSVRALEFYPGSTSDIYAGFLSLGVITSSNAGIDWQSSTVGIATLALNDIETDGDFMGKVLSGFEAENSGGCYLSDNGQWSLVAGLPATRFSAVDIDADGNLFAWSNGPTTIADEGLYKSSDGGVSWIDLGPNIGPVFETEIWTIAISPSNPNLIFIGGNNFGANGWASMIYKSINGGTDWVNVFSGPDFDSFKYIYIDPNANDQNVYAAYASQDFKGGFLKSTDEGNNWSPINTGLPPEAKWAGAIVSDPVNSDILYGGLGGYGGINAKIYISQDAGDSWESSSLTLNNYSKFTDIFVNPQNTDVVYAATSLDGIFMTWDGINWEPSNNGNPASNITAFSRAFEYAPDSLGFFASSFTNSGFHTALYDPTGVGITNTDGVGGLLIFPNPTTGEFHIQSDIQGLGTSEIKILNSLGKEVYREQITSSQENTIHPYLSKGLYLIQVKNSDGKRYSDKLLIR